MSPRAAVLGTGPGGLAIGADLARCGFDVLLGDLPEFPAQLDAIREAGGVTVVSPWRGREVVPVAAAASPAGAGLLYTSDAADEL
jgi:2-polyprenyl-6-methoxyphenol hydroxylase-like FAD-dependent oxidoreductase